MAAPKLEWIESKDHDHNLKWYAGSKQKDKPDHTWRIRQILKSNVVKLSTGMTSVGLLARREFEFCSEFASLDDAKVWCQALEDDAYAAANPVREFTDTEILTAFINNPIYLSVQGTEFICREMGEPVDYFRGKTRREAVSAYLRANPPALPPATEPEPEPDHEMTLREFEEACISNRISVEFNTSGNANSGNRMANLWPFAQGYSDTDTYAPTLAEALAKCLAAIEAAKARNA